MKKLSMVVVFLLLISNLAYGQESGWRDDGTVVRLKDITDKVGIGTSSPSYKLDERGGIAYFNRNDGNNGFVTSLIIPINLANNTPSETYPNREMRLIQWKNDGAYGGGISWGMAPSAGSQSQWYAGAYSQAQFFLFYDGLRLRLQGSNQAPQGSQNLFTPSDFVTFTRTGNVGIGTTNPQSKLHINGSIRGNQSGALRISTEYGYVDIGPKNSAWCHFYTDLPRYFFDKEIRVNSGLIGSYNGNLQLRTSGTTKITILDSNGNVGIGTSNPTHKLDVMGQIKSQCTNPFLELVDTDASSPYHTQYVIGRDGYLLIQAYDGNSWISTMKLMPDTQYFPGNVGIGTTDPGDYKLAVNGKIRAEEIRVNNGSIESYNNDLKLKISGTTRITILNSNGNVGIGTTDPGSYKLAVNGILRAEEIRVNNGSIGSYNGNLQLRTSGTTRITVLNSNGNVGIGTTNPGDYKLAVNGKIRAKEIKVETAGWSDFVFEDNYKLMPLEELAQHIKEKKNLPGIPSEKDVAEKGVNLGEMQSKLLEKIEELTLYVIELKKENENLKKRVAGLEK